MRPMAVALLCLWPQAVHDGGAFRASGCCVLRLSIPPHEPPALQWQPLIYTPTLQQIPKPPRIRQQVPLVLCPQSRQNQRQALDAFMYPRVPSTASIVPPHTTWLAASRPPCPPSPSPCPPPPSSQPPPEAGAEIRQLLGPLLAAPPTLHPQGLHAEVLLDGEPDKQPDAPGAPAVHREGAPPHSASGAAETLGIPAASSSGA